MEFLQRIMDDALLWLPCAVNIISALMNSEPNASISPKVSPFAGLTEEVLVCKDSGAP